jgi:hypothetical protein
VLLSTNALLNAMETPMSAFIIFTLGYMSGSITALLVLGLMTAARHGDRGQMTSMPRVPAEETVAAWRQDR